MRVLKDLSGDFDLLATENYSLHVYVWNRVGMVVAILLEIILRLNHDGGDKTSCDIPG